MRKFVNIVFVAFTVLLSALAAAGVEPETGLDRAIEPGKATVSAFCDDDSLSIRIPVTVDGIRLRRAGLLTIRFSLRNGTKRAELPALTFTGRQRYRFDRRSALVGEEFDRMKDHVVIVGAGTLSDRYDYRASVAYMRWMDSARLYAEYTYNDNCLGSDAGHRSVELCWEGRAEQDRADPGRPVGYESMVCFIEPEIAPAPAVQNERFATVLYFEGSRDRLNLRFGGNDLRLNVLVNKLGLLDDETRSNLAITVTGYASPEGPYAGNERLAHARAANCIDYLKSYDGLFDNTKFVKQWIAEDWAGVEAYLEGVRPGSWQHALQIVRETGIFDGRERALMELGGGKVYKELAAMSFPDLRRAEVSFEYPAAARADSGDRLTDLLAEAVGCEPGGDDYMRIYSAAAELYPDDVTVNNNLAAAFLLRGETTQAARHLEMIGSYPVSYINKGVWCYMTGDVRSARVYFIEAMKANYRQGADNLLLLEKLE